MAILLWFLLALFLQTIYGGKNEQDGLVDPIHGKRICSYGIANATTNEIKSAPFFKKNRNFFLSYGRNSHQFVIDQVFDLLADEGSIYCCALKISKFDTELKNAVDLAKFLIESEEFWQYLGDDFERRWNVTSYLDISIPINERNPMITSDFLGLKSILNFSNENLVAVLRADFENYVKFISKVRKTEKCNSEKLLLEVIQNYVSAISMFFDANLLRLHDDLKKKIRKVISSNDMQRYLTLMMTPTFFKAISNAVNSTGSLMLKRTKDKLLSKLHFFRRKSASDSDSVVGNLVCSMEPAFIYVSAVFRRIPHVSIEMCLYFLQYSWQTVVNGLEQTLLKKLKIGWNDDAFNGGNQKELYEFFLSAVFDEMFVPESHFSVNGMKVSIIDSYKCESPLFDDNFIIFAINRFNKICFFSLHTEASLYGSFFNADSFCGFPFDDKEKFKLDYFNMTRSDFTRMIKSLKRIFKILPKKSGELNLELIFKIFCDSKTLAYKNIATHPDILRYRLKFERELKLNSGKANYKNLLIDFDIFNKIFTVIVELNSKKLSIETEYKTFHIYDFLTLVLKSKYNGKELNISGLTDQQIDSLVPPPYFEIQVEVIALLLIVNHNEKLFKSSTELCDGIFLLFELIEKNSLFSTLLLEDFYMKSVSLSRDEKMVAYVLLLYENDFWMSFKALFDSFQFIVNKDRKLFSILNDLYTGNYFGILPSKNISTIHTLPTNINAYITDFKTKNFDFQLSSELNYFCITTICELLRTCKRDSFDNPIYKYTFNPFYDVFLLPTISFTEYLNVAYLVIMDIFKTIQGNIREQKPKDEAEILRVINDPSSGVLDLNVEAYEFSKNVESVHSPLLLAHSDVDAISPQFQSIVDIDEEEKDLDEFESVLQSYNELNTHSLSKLEDSNKSLNFNDDSVLTSSDKRKIPFDCSFSSYGSYHSMTLDTKDSPSKSKYPIKPSVPSLALPQKSISEVVAKPESSISSTGRSSTIVDGENSSSSLDSKLHTKKDSCDTKEEKSSVDSRTSESHVDLVEEYQLSSDNLSIKDEDHLTVKSFTEDIESESNNSVKTYKSVDKHILKSEISKFKISFNKFIENLSLQKLKIFQNLPSPKDSELAKIEDLFSDCIQKSSIFSSDDILFDMFLHFPLESYCKTGDDVNHEAYWRVIFADVFILELEFNSLLHNDSLQIKSERSIDFSSLSFSSVLPQLFQFLRIIKEFSAEISSSIPHFLELLEDNRRNTKLKALIPFSFNKLIPSKALQFLMESIMSRIVAVVRKRFVYSESIGFSEKCDDFDERDTFLFDTFVGNTDFITTEYGNKLKFHENHKDLVFIDDFTDAFKLIRQKIEFTLKSTKLDIFKSVVLFLLKNGRTGFRYQIPLPKIFAEETPAILKAFYLKYIFNISRWEFHLKKVSLLLPMHKAIIIKNIFHIPNFKSSSFPLSAEVFSALSRISNSIAKRFNNRFTAVNFLTAITPLFLPDSRSNKCKDLVKRYTESEEYAVQSAEGRYLLLSNEFWNELFDILKKTPNIKFNHIKQQFVVIEKTAPIVLNARQFNERRQKSNLHKPSSQQNKLKKILFAVLFSVSFIVMGTLSIGTFFILKSYRHQITNIK